MSQVQPTIELAPVVPPKVEARRFKLPGWLVLLLRNPKSRIGMAMVGFMVIVAMVAVAYAGFCLLR